MTIKQLCDGLDTRHTNPQTLEIDIKQLCDGLDTRHTNPQRYMESRTGQQHQMPTGRGQYGDFKATAEVQSSQSENLMASGNSGDPTFIQTCGRTSIPEDSSGNYQGIGICQCHPMVTGQASKPLVNLVNDHSDFVENIFERLDTYVDGAGHYEVIAKYFRFSIYTIKSRFEKADGGPSRAMIEAIVACYPEITVQSFAELVEKKARRRDVANLLRDYDLDSLKESEDLSYIQ